MVVASVEYPSPCKACGALMQCSATQVLLGDGLHWDVQSNCSACGTVAACGRGDIPADLRGRLLEAHGPARLEIVDPAPSPVSVMKVLRTELGVDLPQMKEILRRVLAGSFTGTLPEMELLATRLREVGIQAAARRAS
ncbi:hypothetical protein ABZ801_37520 [Actinomadura sp. NPDC047616]|uniref:hypothetical protein n=1 Tax=Actinomadura sp. NPDC047616 TaxID=3155914 RepID=UPI0033E9C798